jgi:acyl-coenzyme A synthetase/AMP-(fatty) acid ligase
MMQLDTLLADHARRRGERVYLEALQPRARLTFAELDRACHRVGHLLAAHGVEPGDRVSVLSDNCAELVVLFLGILRYGAVVNPLNVEVSLKNLPRILHDVEPRLVIWNRSAPADVASIVAAAGTGTMSFGPADGDLFDRLEAFPAAPASRRPVPAETIGVIDYTSGTTATPKGVCISHEAFWLMGDGMADRLRLTDGDRMLDYRVLSWASPQVMSFGPTLLAGATYVLAPRFSRRRFFDWVREHAVTVSIGVPAVLNMLLDRPVDIRRHDVPTLKFITSSSAPLAVERQCEFERRYGIPIVQMCGMTEAGVMGGNPPEALRAGSIGPPLKHIDARFVDDAGGECVPGQEGELCVRGPQLASAYLTGRGAVEPIPREGFRTGDIGYRDGDGYLYLTGRKKDLIIRGGVNIAPLEITAALLTHEAVAEAATIGVPDPVYGEAVVSFVAFRPGRTPGEEELWQHCRTRLSDFKLPARIIVVEAIPTTERGKIARERLLALARLDTT